MYHLLIDKPTNIYNRAPGLTFLGNHIPEPYMVPYRPYKFFVYDLAMVSKISIYDSYMASKNPIWSFVRSFNAHTKLMQQFQLQTLYTTYDILVPYMVLTWSIYIPIWSIYGSYIVHIWFLNVSYMTHSCNQSACHFKENLVWSFT